MARPARSGAGCGGNGVDRSGALLRHGVLSCAGMVRSRQVRSGGSVDRDNWPAGVHPFPLPTVQVRHLDSGILSHGCLAC